MRSGMLRIWIIAIIMRVQVFDWWLVVDKQFQDFVYKVFYCIIELHSNYSEHS